MIDAFSIGAYWKNRKQLLDSIINPTVQTLKGLGEIDEQFVNLYELGRSRKQALEHKISLSSEYIRELYLRGTKNNDLDQSGYSKIGYSLWVWTGHTDEEASNLSFSVGKSSERLSNVCLIKIPSEGVARDRLLNIEKIKKIIALLIQNWDPDMVVLNSRELSNKLDIMNEVGWVTYRKRLTGKPKLNDKVIHDSSFCGGHLFYLNSQNVYDYDLIDNLVPITKVI